MAIKNIHGTTTDPEANVIIVLGHLLLFLLLEERRDGLGLVGIRIWVDDTYIDLGLTCWARVAGLPLSSLPRAALMEQRALLAAGKPCWLLHYRKQAAAVPLAEDLWQDWWARGGDEDFSASTARTQTTRDGEERVVHVLWKAQLQEAFTEAADAQWRARVHSSATSQDNGGGNKLRTYARFKEDVGQEAYLSTNMKAATKSLLCRFRIGVAPLQVELGRRQPGGQGSRACPVCGYHREDEEHFLMGCPLYEELRPPLGNAVTAALLSKPQAYQQTLRRWEGGLLTDRFDVIMAMQDKDAIRALVTFLEQAWTLRTSFLTAMAGPAVPLEAGPPQAQDAGGQGEGGGTGRVGR